MDNVGVVAQMLVHEGTNLEQNAAPVLLHLSTLLVNLRLHHLDCDGLCWVICLEVPYGSSESCLCQVDSELAALAHPGPTNNTFNIVVDKATLLFLQSLFEVENMTQKCREVTAALDVLRCAGRLLYVTAGMIGWNRRRGEGGRTEPGRKAVLG